MGDGGKVVPWDVGRKIGGGGVTKLRINPKVLPRLYIYFFLPWRVTMFISFLVSLTWEFWELLTLVMAMIIIIIMVLIMAIAIGYGYGYGYDHSYSHNYSYNYNHDINY